MSSGRPSGSHRTIVLALCGLVLLLAGVIAGQNLERSRTADQSAHVSRLPADAAAGADNARATPRRPLSGTEYWISTPELDATRTGFSVWAVLRPGGNFIVERCRAPDYAIPAQPGARAQLPIALCESIVDGVISELGDDRLVVRAGDDPPQTFRFSLRRNGATESLVLDVGKKVTLVPGSKNALFQRLGELQADAEARNRYMQWIFAGGAAARPTGSRAP